MNLAERSLWVTSVIVLIGIIGTMTYSTHRYRVDFAHCLHESSWTVEAQNIDRVFSDDAGHDLLQWDYRLSCDDVPRVRHEFSRMRPSWLPVGNKMRFRIHPMNQTTILQPTD